jgi:hypothetical protein
MRLENISTANPTLGGFHCHRTYSILFDGLDWAEHEKKRLL